MKAELNKDQVFQLVANAVNASMPMGLGFIHAEVKTYTAADIEASPAAKYFDKDGISIDYYKGRMVKLHIRRVDEGEYNIQPDNPQIDYQSWMVIYPTTQDLINSVIEEKADV